MNQLLDLSLAEAMKGAEPNNQVDLLFAYLTANGQSFYDEIVTQLQHALQCAENATIDAGSDSEVAAALLHDIGHFLIDENDQSRDFLTEDFCHEEVGAGYMTPFIVVGVTEPMRLHVPAKRYLCTTDSTYYETLSEASKRSFKLQGGFMSEREKAEFEANDFCEQAVKLRRWDDMAKAKNRETLGLETHRKSILACLSS